MELIKEYADQNTPDILTEKENECISDFIRPVASFTAYRKYTRAKKSKKS